LWLNLTRAGLRRAGSVARGLKAVDPDSPQEIDWYEAQALCDEEAASLMMRGETRRLAESARG
jgi:hypothetical protein